MSGFDRELGFLEKPEDTRLVGLARGGIGKKLTRALRQAEQFGKDQKTGVLAGFIESVDGQDIVPDPEPLGGAG